jgi:branched-chain amino acid aminotransferase
MAEPMFDDRDGLIWYNGELVDWRDSHAHLLTHTLHYGGGCFEGERAYNGKIFKMDQHHQRLLDGAAVLNLDHPYSREDINKAAMDVLAANNLTDAYLRPLMWRGGEQVGLAGKGCSTNLAIMTWPWPSYFSAEKKAAGLKLGISKWKRPSPENAPVHMKICGLYVICTLSSHEAINAGFDDALMMDYRGLIAETTGSNVFFIKDGEIHTPKPDCFLNGITRQTLVELAKDRHIIVHERHIKPEELASFDECFLTGTAYEVMAVQSIGENKYTPSEITRTLAQDYDNLVNGR